MTQKLTILAAYSLFFLSSMALAIQEDGKNTDNDTIESEVRVLSSLISGCRGFDVQQANLKEGLRDLIIKSSQGDREAQDRLEIVRSIASTCNDTEEETEEELIAQADQGDVEAQYYLGEFFVETNRFKKGIYYLELAAEQEDKDAQALLGKVYEQMGDTEKSDYYYQLAALHGSSLAQEELRKNVTMPFFILDGGMKIDQRES